MEANYFWPFRFVEVTTDRFTNLEVKLLQRVGLSEDRHPQSTCYEAPLGSLFNGKDDLGICAIAHVCPSSYQNGINQQPSQAASPLTSWQETPENGSRNIQR